MNMLEEIIYIISKFANNTSVAPCIVFILVKYMIVNEKKDWNKLYILNISAPIRSF